MSASISSRNQQPCGNQQPQTVQVRTVTAQNAVGVSAQVSADAFGQGTFANTQVYLTTIDRGLASFAIAVVGAEAAAQGSDDQSQLATASAVVTMVGADISVTNNKTVTGSDAQGMNQQATTSAIGASFAFDTGSAHQVDGSAVETCRSSVGSLQGNLATFSADVTAHGENSFVDMQADAIALEDQYSSSIVSATSAIDADVVYTEYVGTRCDDTIATGDGDSLVRGNRGDDAIRAGNGDDWLFGGDGDDRISGGGGNDTAFGGDGRDNLGGGDGDDWLFGGDGKDTLSGDIGNDLILGGDGKDILSGGSGGDLLDGGGGHDDLSGGVGNDMFRLGSSSGDGDDRMQGGAGADTYLIAGAFENDIITDFSLDGGDRIAVEGLDTLVGSRSLSMERDRGDRDDLVVTLRLDGERSTLTLDEFFVNNPGFGALPVRGAFTPQQTAMVMHAIVVDADADPALTDAQLTFQLGDLLAVFG